MFGLGAGEVVIILVLALIFIGPKKLPELARSLGKSLREFQKAKDEMMSELDMNDSNRSKKDSKASQIGKESEGSSEKAPSPKSETSEDVKCEKQAEEN